MKTKGMFTWMVRGWAPVVLRYLAIGFVVMLLGSCALPAHTQSRRLYAIAVAGWGFNLVTWEIDALGEKLNPFSRVQPDATTDLGETDVVLTYLQRAQEMSQIEHQLVRIASGTGPIGEGEGDDKIQLQADLMHLRIEQKAVRHRVEQLLQGQIDFQLSCAGFGVGGYVVPPVFFTFTEPPKTLIVSPREGIISIYSRMLDAEISLEMIEEAEAVIRNELDASAYITEIGGLGAYPTMVVDRAGLEWILSTVAHEWVHNYLTLFPLGWNYFSDQQMTTINETVAEIVGNEIGAAALHTFYPDLAMIQKATIEKATEKSRVQEPVAFQFITEMRKTRLEVDRMLSSGNVTEAEHYMEQRRLIFVEEGYPLRVLNQAYFAFHGSYGTSGASSSPIGPKLFALRSNLPSLLGFLQTVRWFTSATDLDGALAAHMERPYHDQESASFRVDSPRHHVVDPSSSCSLSSSSAGSSYVFSVASR